MWEWMHDWGGWIAAVSGMMFLVSLWLVTWFIIRVPEGYFITEGPAVHHSNRVLHYFILLLRNGIGFFLLAAGMAMLVLPGQGVITMIMGVSLISLPGKHRLLNWILQRQRVRQTLNWIRQKAGKEALLFTTQESSQS